MSSLWAGYIDGLMRGLTQEAMADKVGVTQTTISRWLNGKYIPTDARVLVKIGQEFGRPEREPFVAAGYLADDPSNPITVREHFVLDWTRRSQPFESVCGKVWRTDPESIATARCPDCVEIVGSMWSK